MKVETLNLNGGKLFQPLMSFIDDSAGEVDIFCFQEAFDNNSGITESHGARANLYKEIYHALPGFTGIYCPAEGGLDYDGHVDFDLTYGIATFIRNNFEVMKDGYTTVYEGGEDVRFGHMPRNLQYVLVRDSGGVETLVANLHGLWIPGYKGDSKTRLKQSRLTRAFLDQQNPRQILVGDLNLNPKTESFKILVNDRRDLVTEYGIETTRTVRYDKPHNPHADYIIVPPKPIILVRDFQAIDEIVSDHKPLLVDCN